MTKVHFSFVPMNGGEQDHFLVIKMESVPQVGDWVSILAEDEVGTNDFVVTQRHWQLRPSKADPDPYLLVECEFARSSDSAASHVEAYEQYAKKGGKENLIRDTMY